MHNQFMRFFVASSLLVASSIAFAQGKSNPDISVNFLGEFRSGNGLSKDPKINPHKGFNLREAEIQMMSDIDPYLRASALFAVGQDDGKYEIAPEEIYLETISLPHVTLRAGKFKMALGKHNLLHTHGFSFLDAPLIHQRLVGAEGLNESGVSAAYLIPTPWFSEFTFQTFSLQNEALYGSADSGDLGVLGKFKNLWDITDDLTMELGLSATRGKSQFGEIASIAAADLTMKWRPATGGKYTAFIWSTEYLSGERPGLLEDQTNPSSRSAKSLAGFASWIQYQFAQRWWAQARYEVLGTSHSAGIEAQNKQSYLLGFFPSEFSGFRLQYDHVETRGVHRPEDSLGLQFNVTIGAHPAHSY